MKVRTYLIILILGYSVCGLLVFFLLNTIHQGEARLAKTLGQSKLTLRDIGSLERNVHHWLLLSDLVLGSDESYLCTGALSSGDDVDKILETLMDEISVRHRSHVKTIQEFAERQKIRLIASQSLAHVERQSQLDDLLMQMDTDSESVIVSLEKLESAVSKELEFYQSQLDTKLSRRLLLNGSLLLVFIGSAIVLLFWISAIVSRPISNLAHQSTIKNNQVRNFVVKSTAPKEVQQLAGSLSELVGDLEYQIQEHKKTQVERAKLHRKLMDASRRAGMADVASEVLHNVGNVLNSLNVSATVIRRSLDKSLVTKLSTANRQFSQHKDNYGQYLQTDPKGKHFPAALDFITGALVTERETHLAESHQLLKNIDHVRKVIQQQLSMSRDSGVVETFCLHDLIEQCIEINREKSKRVNATITFECPATLNLVTDRHKLQQVLINLVSNAIDALQHSEQGSGLIHIVATSENETVQISITDNGIGISPENLEKVFSQGFTTKANGHGYGLHSCAMTAQVLGGTLNVDSQGDGFGACFRLVIPLSQLELCKI